MTPVLRCGYSSPMWFTTENAFCLVSFLLLQFLIVESTGKKVLMYRGYMGMSATLVLLIITLYLQVSQHKTIPCLLHVLML